jgi:thioredoxin-like negative regulator of GroEL
MQRLGMSTAATEHFQYASQSTRAQNEIMRLTRRIQDEPDNVELRFEIAQLSDQFMLRDDAAKWMHMVLEIQPNHAGALRGLVDYYKSKGEISKSREFQRRLSEQGQEP